MNEEREEAGEPEAWKRWKVRSKGSCFQLWVLSTGSFFPVMISNWECRWQVPLRTETSSMLEGMEGRLLIRRFPAACKLAKYCGTVEVAVGKESGREVERDR